ncbi:hypothetical protein HK405_001131, partial [Cladochytrium tenue]
IHASFAFDVPLDDALRGNGSSPSSPASAAAAAPRSLLVEFVSPSVTSPSPLESLGLGALNPAVQRLLPLALPHMHFADLSRRGYLVLTVGRDRAACEFWYVSDVRRRRRAARAWRQRGEGVAEAETLGARVVADRGANRITSVE